MLFHKIMTAPLFKKSGAVFVGITLGKTMEDKKSFSPVLPSHPHTLPRNALYVGISDGEG